MLRSHEIAMAASQAVRGRLVPRPAWSWTQLEMPCGGASLPTQFPEWGQLTPQGGDLCDSGGAVPTARPRLCWHPEEAPFPRPSRRDVLSKPGPGSPDGTDVMGLWWGLLPSAPLRQAPQRRWAGGGSQAQYRGRRLSRHGCPLSHTGPTRSAVPGSSPFGRGERKTRPHSPGRVGEVGVMRRPPGRAVPCGLPARPLRGAGECWWRRLPPIRSGG